jgi:Ras-related protein Rab-18
VLTYDVTNRASFESVEAWAKEASMYCTYDNVVQLLVANKIDRDDAVVPRADGERFAREHGMVFVECSAKTRKNIEQVFEEIVLKFLERSDLWAEGNAGAAPPKMYIKPAEAVDNNACAC